MSDEFRMYYTWKIKDVLFEEKVEINGKSYYTGYTKEYVKVAVQSEEKLDNAMKTGKITAAIHDDLYLMDWGTRLEVVFLRKFVYNILNKACI